LERALALFERALGPDHPRVGLTLEHLAVVLGQLGDAAGAPSLLQRAGTIAEKPLRPRHPPTPKTPRPAPPVPPPPPPPHSPPPRNARCCARRGRRPPASPAMACRAGPLPSCCCDRPSGRLSN